jgi:hypothetical protein
MIASRANRLGISRQVPRPRGRAARLMNADWSSLYAAGDRVIARFGEDGAALSLHLGNGHWFTMTPLMGAVWWMLEEQDGRDLESAVRITAERTGRPPATFREEVQGQLPRLIEWGLLSDRQKAPRAYVSGFAPRGVASQCGQRVTAIDPATPPSASYRTAAFLAFYTAVVLRLTRPYLSWITGRRITRGPSQKLEHSLLPLWLTLRVIAAICRLRAQRPTMDSTQRAVATVRRAARHHLGWADCYEITIGSLILLALQGRAPTFCIGGIPGRGLRHAWLVCGDVAVDHADQRTYGLPILALVAINQPTDTLTRSDTAETRERLQEPLGHLSDTLVASVVVGGGVMVALWGWARSALSVGREVSKDDRWCSGS